MDSCSSKGERETVASNMECLKEDAKMILAVEIMLTNPVVKVIDEFILSS